MRLNFKNFKKLHLDPYSIAYKLLGKIGFLNSDKVLKRFEDLRKSMIKARMTVFFNAYVHFIFFTSIVSAITAFAVSYIAFPKIFPNLNSYVLLILSTGIALLAFGVAFGVTYSYPAYKASTLGRDIDNYMLYAVNYISILMASGALPDRIFETLGEMKELKGVNKEALFITRNIKLLGKDMLSSLKLASTTTPSRKFAEFLEGYIYVLRTGARLKEYLAEQGRRAIEEKRVAFVKFTGQLSILAEMYVAMSVVFPLISVIVLMTLSALGGALGPFSPLMLAYIVVYVLVPLSALAIILIVDAMMPKG